MRYFQGCGYSDEFTENMRYVISNLKNGSEVILTRGCDDICRKCPNNRKNMCCDGVKVKSYDSAVISSCNLDFDKVYEYGCLYILILMTKLFKGIQLIALLTKQKSNNFYSSGL